MRAINVDEYVSDLEQVRAIVRNDSKTVAIVEKLQHMIDEYAKQHAVEVESVRHGRWIETDYFDSHKVPIYECSVCFKEVADHYIKCHKFCLHCGAKMDLKE